MRNSFRSIFVSFWLFFDCWICEKCCEMRRSNGVLKWMHSFWYYIFIHLESLTSNCQEQQLQINNQMNFLQFVDSRKQRFGQFYLGVFFPSTNTVMLCSSLLPIEMVGPLLIPFIHRRTLNAYIFQDKNISLLLLFSKVATTWVCTEFHIRMQPSSFSK